VLPIGGLKEKTMAALRYGISTVIIPEDNCRDLEEIDPVVCRSLNFVTAKTIDTVLETALKRDSQVLPGILPDMTSERNSQKRKSNICQ
jgi:ATP-dependent Lon protease